MSMLGKNLASWFPLSEQRISQVFTQNLSSVGEQAAEVTGSVWAWDEKVLPSLEEPLFLSVMS